MSFESTQQKLVEDFSHGKSGAIEAAKTLYDELGDQDRESVLNSAKSTYNSNRASDHSLPPLDIKALGGEIKRQEAISQAETKEAIAAVKNLPEVKDFFKQVPQGHIGAEAEGHKQYSVQVFENVDNDHNTTFGWYSYDAKNHKVSVESP